MNYRLVFKGNSKDLLKAMKQNGMGHLKVITRKQDFSSLYVDVELQSHRDFYRLVDWFCNDYKLLFYSEVNEGYEKPLKATPQYWSKLTDELTANTKNSSHCGCVSGKIQK